MDRVIDYRKVKMSDAEFEYYNYLVGIFSDAKNGVDGRDYFKGLFDTDEDGFITIIKTDKKVPWAILFFVQQLMLSQRVKLIDDFVKRKDKKLDEICNIVLEIQRKEEQDE